ncbi:hypothetical protein ACFX13_037678 [Malus domestica]
MVDATEAVADRRKQEELINASVSSAAGDTMPPSPRSILNNPNTSDASSWVGWWSSSASNALPERKLLIREIKLNFLISHEGKS